MVVQAEISKEEARQLLSRQKSLFPKWIKRKQAPLKRIELIYLPFYRFEVSLTTKGESHKATIALDGLVGSTPFFVKDDLNFSAEAREPACDFVLKTAEAKTTALRKYRWMLLEHDLRNKKMTTVDHISDGERMLYPFWVGYYQRGKSYEFKAVDGVSGEVQGIKMRQVFLRAFRQLR